MPKTTDKVKAHKACADARKAYDKACVKACADAAEAYAEAIKANEKPVPTDD